MAAEARPTYRDGYRRPEPRVVMFQSTPVYAAFCYSCSADDRTHWERLPTLEEVTKDRIMHFFGIVRAVCSRCERSLDYGAIDVFYAREPERLEARLAELRSEAARRSSDSPSEGRES